MKKRASEEKKEERKRDERFDTEEETPNYQEWETVRSRLNSLEPVECLDQIFDSIGKRFQEWIHTKDGYHSHLLTRCKLQSVTSPTSSSSAAAATSTDTANLLSYDFMVQVMVSKDLSPASDAVTITWSFHENRKLAEEGAPSPPRTETTMEIWNSLQKRSRLYPHLQRFLAVLALHSLFHAKTSYTLYPRAHDGDYHVRCIVSPTRECGFLVALITALPDPWRRMWYETNDFEASTQIAHSISIAEKRQAEMSSSPSLSGFTRLLLRKGLDLLQRRILHIFTDELESDFSRFRADPNDLNEKDDIESATSPENLIDWRSAVLCHRRVYRL